MDPKPERTLNIRQAVEATGVAERTIYYWIRAGKVRTIRTPTGVRIIESSLPRKNTAIAPQS